MSEPSPTRRPWRTATGVPGSWREPSEWALRLEDGLAQASTAGALAVGMVLVSVGVGLVVPPLAILTALALQLAWGVVVIPGPLRWALVRAGRAPLAARLARLEPWTWRRDPEGAAAAVLGLGLLRAPHDARLKGLLDAELARTDRAFGASRALAAGIRAWCAGEREDAHRLLGLVREFDRSKRPPLVARWAVDLDAAIAADQGDFDAMRRILDHPRSPSTPFGGVLRGCADRAAGRPIQPGELWWWWWLAGAPEPLSSRVRSTVALRPTAPPARPPLTDDVLQDALVATTRLYGGGALRRAAVADASERWERALAEPARVPDGALGAARLRAEVVGMLGERLGRCVDPADAPPSGAILREASWACGERLDQELQWLADELGARTDQRRPLALVDEARAWAALVGAFQRVVDVCPERASSSFAKLYYPSVRHTVWLHNERGQSALANAMYRVELRYAELVKHDAGIPLLEKNLRCGP